MHREGGHGRGIQADRLRLGQDGALGAGESYMDGDWHTDPTADLGEPVVGH